MADREVELYKERVAKVTEHWMEEIEDDLKALAEINKAIALVEKDGSTPPAPYKSLQEMKKKSADIQKSIEDAKLSFQKNLEWLDPPKSVPKQDAKNLSDDLKTVIVKKVKEIIKKKGIPIGDSLLVKPDIDFDPTKLKLKKVYLELVWRF